MSSNHIYGEIKYDQWYPAYGHRNDHGIEKLERYEVKFFDDIENPYQINQMKPYFYTTFLPEIKKLDKQNTNAKVYLVTNNYNEHKKISINKNCMLNYTTYPLILINLVDNLKNRKMNWYLYKCNAK